MVVRLCLFEIGPGEADLEQRLAWNSWDRPDTPVSKLRKLAEQHREKGAPAVQTTCALRRGPPRPAEEMEQNSLIIHTVNCANEAGGGPEGLSESHRWPSAWQRNATRDR